MNKNIIKRVIRAGGLVETNSSSSHALSICGNRATYARPGDPEFDLDIHDGTLFVPCRCGDFGWEYEKSNSCLTKLQYVCGLFFSQYLPLYKQKRPAKLEKILKDYLGVKRVVFEWEEKYIEAKKSGKSDEDCYLASPSIDHNSYSDSEEEILENSDTILDFIFNKNSWYFGGNDNSTAPRGYYKEMRIDKSETNGTVSIDYQNLGRIDFRVDLFYQEDWWTKDAAGLHLAEKIKNDDEIRLFDSIYYYKGKFCIDDNSTASKINDKEAYTYLLEYIDSGKIKLVYVKGTNDKMPDIMKLYNEGKSVSSLLNYIPETDYVEVVASLTSDEFGELYGV